MIAKYDNIILIDLSDALQAYLSATEEAAVLKEEEEEEEKKEGRDYYSSSYENKVPERQV